MATPILTTKLFIPQLREDLVSRQHLIRRLNEGFNRKLTLVSAPAGFGKSTLISEWINQCENPSCWLSLDQQDNDLTTFVSYMIAGLQSIHIKFDEHFLATLYSQQSDVIEALLIPLINQISAAEQRFSFVLDDCHLIQNSEIHNALTYLINNLPQNMHLIIVTRTDPPVRLAQIRAQSELCEIRAEDLRFSVEDAICFLNQSMRLSLSISDVRTLTEKTEGWIVGLQLAAISLQNQSDRHEFVAAFAGNDRYIADYLLDEVLDQQPSHIQTFLLRTSILDQFCAPLCDAVIERNDSQVILTELERANLFLVPLDNQRNWYRYHHLFADLLRIRQIQEGRDSMAELYQRASSWYEQQQMISEAVRLALLGDDTEKVAQLMQGHLLAVVSTSELSVMNRLLASLPKETINTNPWLALAMAWGLAYVWQLDAVKPLLENAVFALQNFGQKAQRRLQGRILVLQAYVAGCRSDYTASTQIAQDALNNIPDNDLSMRSFTILIIGNAYRFRGNLERAIEFHNTALSLSEQAGDTFLSVIILTRLTDIYRIMGKLNRAYQVGIQALEKVETYQNQIGLQSFILGYLKLRLCKVYYGRNELESAVQCAESGLELARQWGAYDSMSLGYFNVAKIYQSLGDYRKALNYLREFKESYPSKDRQQYKTASAIESEIYLHIGNLQEANDWMESFGMSPNDRIQFQEFQLYDVLAQVLIARGELSHAQTLLERLLNIAQESGAGEYEIQTLGRMALVHHEKGDEDAALTNLARALALAAPEGYQRVFLDQGEAMVQLLYKAALDGIQSEFCNRLLVQFSSSTTPDLSPQDDLIEPLSDREIEVLKLIAQGLTNREIAQSLILSLYTVKSHARNIFSKLGVKNRTEAVAKARLFGLLS